MYKKTDSYDSGRGNPFENLVYNPYKEPTSADTTESNSVSNNTTNKITNKVDKPLFNSTGQTK